jgi:hypothetical protein
MWGAKDRYKGGQFSRRLIELPTGDLLQASVGKEDLDWISVEIGIEFHHKFANLLSAAQRTEPQNGEETLSAVELSLGPARYRLHPKRPRRYC